MAAIIARRLLGVALLFALLDIGIVLVTYVRDREGWGSAFCTLQADEIAEAITVGGGTVMFDPARLYREPIGAARLAFAVYDRHGKAVDRGRALAALAHAGTADHLGQFGDTARRSRHGLHPCAACAA